MENSLWCEKYRPNKVEDCVLTSEIKDVAVGILANNKLPNLIMGGSAGTGKTTLAKAICNELGYESMIINLSNDRGIDVLRTNITQFASSVALCSDMKVCILDEADYSTPLLQAALRNFMEEFSKTTRFIMTCNSPQKIIQPLHSRCAVLDFTIRAKDKPQIATQIMKRVVHILNSENVEFEKAAVAKVVSKYFPDFRRTINELQRYASICGKIDEGILSGVEKLEVGDLVNALKNKDFRSARKWIVESLAVTDQHVIFRSIYDLMYDIMEPSSIPSAVILIANYQYKAISCVDPEVNMSAFVIEMMQEIEWK